MPGQIGHFRFPDEDDNDVVDRPLQTQRVDPEVRPAPPSTQPQPRSAPRPYPELICAGGALLTLFFSFAPYYGTAERAQTIPAACGRLRSTDLQRCIEENSQQQKYVANLHWNAWGSWLSWPAIVLFLIVAAVVAFKAVFSKSEKVVLSRQVRLGLLLADLLFLVSVFHVPHDNAGRSWGLWLSLICVIAINVGVLLATTEVGEWVAEHWPQRAEPSAPVTPPPTPAAGHQADYRPTPQAMPPGHRQPNWPPPAGQQAPPLGHQHFPPSDPR